MSFNCLSTSAFSDSARLLETLNFVSTEKYKGQTIECNSEAFIFWISCWKFSIAAFYKITRFEENNSPDLELYFLLLKIVSVNLFPVEVRFQVVVAILEQPFVFLFALN